MDVNVTQLLQEWKLGDSNAFNQLIEELYPTLKSIAQSHMRGERDSHTLQATAIVNEAYEKMAELDQAWQNREHFLSLASRIMRHILVDYARSKLSQKRGGDWLPVTFNEELLAGLMEPTDLLAIDKSLQQLTEIDKVAADAIEKRVFVGMTNEEIASVNGVSLATVERKIKFAKAWLFHEMNT